MNQVTRFAEIMQLILQHSHKSSPACLKSALFH
jgi:hypothetical protein